MPKSSRTRRTPSSLSASSVAVALADSSTRTLSVISSRRLTGSSPVRVEDLGDRVGEVAVGDLAGREVDRDVERPPVGPQRVPAERLAAGGLLHPAADRLDQAAVLGDRDELAGVEHAALGVLPADQRLEADDLAAAQRDRPAGSGARARRARARWRSSRSVSSRRTARARISASNISQRPRPALLGPVHRRVGVADQQVGVDRLAARGGRATAMPTLAVTKWSAPPIE